jgi:hypothetical protein
MTHAVLCLPDAVVTTGLQVSLVDAPGETWLLTGSGLASPAAASPMITASPPGPSITVLRI